MKLWRYLHTKLQDNQRVYLLTVIENSGSSPGRKGFKMLVTQDGFILGSVGGGVMEFALVEEAKKLLREEHPPTFIKKQIHKGDIKDGSGMICSGEQTIAFHYLDTTHLGTVTQLIHSLEKGQKGCLHLGINTFQFSEELLPTQFAYEIHAPNDWYFKEHIGFKDTLYIVGGGHVGVAVSELFEKLGFYVIVFDNRPHLNTLEANTFAHEKHIINYRNIASYIQPGMSSYVAIMTNKYTDDKLVLSRLLENSYRFLGVLGSKAKLKTMWEVFHKEGVPTQQLDKVHAPIGLSIKSETPEEIAVSIAAQIIRIKNQQ